MIATMKLRAGAPMPVFSVPRVGGGEVTVGTAAAWQMVVVYRGRHCPICRKYLKVLDGLVEDFRAIDTEVVAISADTPDKAQSEAAEEDWHFSVGHSLALQQMRALGLYISEPRSPQETDRPFAEPGLFIVNPAHCAQVIDISNAPFARPDLLGVLNGLKFIREKDYPVRGTVE